MKQRTKKPINRIKPETKWCMDCKKGRVTSHHWLCDSCYSKMQKQKNIEKKNSDKAWQNHVSKVKKRFDSRK